MSDFAFKLISFLGVIALLVVVHEFGHYALARLCGVKVLRFSFGFGKVLVSRKLGGDQTEWVVSAFPLGGYVKMLDEREAPVAPEELHRAFNRQSVAKRFLIVAAGPLANFLLALLLYWAAFTTGVNELLPVLGKPPLGTPAAMSGIGNGDLVRSVDGQTVQTWNEFRWLLLQKAVDRDEVKLELLKPGQSIEFPTLSLKPIQASGWREDALDLLGLRFFRPEAPARVGKVIPDGVAFQAGIQAGDLFLAIDGVPISTWLDAVEKIRSSPGKLLTIAVLRDDIELSIGVVPDAIQERGVLVGKIGVGVAETAEMKRQIKTLVSYAPSEALLKAFRETWDKSVFTLVMMGKMVQGEVSLKNISGPVTIAQYAGQSARLGLDYYLQFMAMVSISLGVLNLLPVPVLDGGHLMYYMIEVVRRRPLSERAMELGQQVGLAILLVLMAFAFFNDLSRLFYG